MSLVDYWMNVAVGVGCGALAGWVLRGKLRPKMIAQTAANAKIETASMSDGGELKLIIVVRNDLKMGKGKMAAQCCHASVMAYESLAKKDPELLHDWRMHGQPKVVVKTDSEESLLELAQAARKLGLTASIVCDAGRTQIAPGSKTTLGVGPGPASIVDEVTGHLKLM